MNVTACLVTRGDVDLSEIINSIAEAGISQIVIWDNSKRERDLAVFGRYAAIDEAEHDLIYVQDDDVLHTPDGIRSMITRWHQAATATLGSFSPDGLHFVVCNMPQRFREQPFYASGHHALVGFGACFHRDTPQRAFERFEHGCAKLGRRCFILKHEPQVVLYEPPPLPPPERHGVVRWRAAKVLSHSDEDDIDLPWFWRTCDIPFTCLTPRVLVDVHYTDMPWASDDNRMWRQRDHIPIRQKMLDLCLQVRDL